MGCRQPVGSIVPGGGGTGGSVDFWFIEVVKRSNYYVGDDFIRDKAYYITAFQSGDEVRIMPSDPNVITEIVLNPDSEIYFSLKEAGETFPFTESGEHEVRVTYGGKTRTYRITVIGADVSPGGNLGGLGGGIIWN